MSFKTPLCKCSTTIPGLGRLDGYQYDNGVQQYCGIPYARLEKRWTRSVINTKWEGEYHDGTKMGYASLSVGRKKDMNELTDQGMTVLIP